MNKQGQWEICTREGKKFLNNQDYLNYLLELSNKFSSTLDKVQIKWLIFDLEEFLQNSPKIYHFTVINEVSNLKRFLKLQKKEEYKRTAMILLD